MTNDTKVNTSSKQANNNITAVLTYFDRLAKPNNFVYYEIENLSLSRYQFSQFNWNVKTIKHTKVQ